MTYLSKSDLSSVSCVIVSENYTVGEHCVCVLKQSSALSLVPVHLIIIAHVRVPIILTLLGERSKNVSTVKINCVVS